MSTVKNKTVAFGAVLVMCMTAFAGMCMFSDESDASVAAGGYVEIESIYWDWADTDANWDEGASVDTVFGVTISPRKIDYTDPPMAMYYLPQWASGTLRVSYTVMDGGGVDLIDEGTFTDTVTGTYGLSSSRPITDKVDPSISIYNHIGSKTIYVAKGTQFDLHIGCGYSVKNVTLSNNSSGLYVTASSYGGDVKGTLNSDVTINFSGTWATGTQVSGSYVIKAVQTSVTHTVTYAGNGNTGGSTANTVVTDTNSGNSNVTLAACGFTKSGYTFTGWKIGNTVYQPGQTVSVSGNGSVTATAQWSQNTLSASANSIYALSGMSYTNQIGASANNGGTLSYAVKTCTGGTASVNGSGVVTYNAPTVSSTTAYSVTVTVTGTFSGNQTMTKDVSFNVTVDPVFSFTNAATSGTLTVKGA